MAKAADPHLPAFKPTYVGDLEVIGACECCGQFILETDVYSSDEDCCHFCETCSLSTSEIDDETA